MSYWLADALRATREAAKVSRNAIAKRLDVDPSTVFRLEKGAGLTRDVERYVAAYAELCGVEDGRQLWRDALNRWMDHGAPPQVSWMTDADPPPQGDPGSSSAPERIAREIRETEQREKAKRAREPDSGQAGRSATRRRRAAG